MIKQLALALCIGSLLSLPACKECCSAKKATEQNVETSIDAQVEAEQNQNCTDVAPEASAEEAPAKF